jgi:DNA-binding LacI/PurR family transcriptional regulator
LVSLVMRDSPRVSDASRAKVLAAADELGYRPNRLARNLAQGRTDTVGAMVNDLTNPFFTEMIQGVANAAAEHGLEVLVNSGWGRPDGETEAIESLLDLRVTGICLGGARLPLDDLAGFAARGPLVAVSVFDRPDAFDTVSNDEGHGAELVVDHLTALGHERIAHIYAPKGAGGPQRRACFADAMAARGLEPILVEGDFTEEAGAAGTDALLSGGRPPTAILAANDLAAVGVLGRLAAAGLSVPGDISVVGYDDTSLAGIEAISLTTVHQPRQQLGRRALELLRERVAGRATPCHEQVRPELQVRTSTGPVR